MEEEDDEVEEEEDEEEAEWYRSQEREQYAFSAMISKIVESLEGPLH